MPLLTRKRVIKVAPSASENANGTEIPGTIDIYVEDLEINPTSEFIRRAGSGRLLGNENLGLVEGQAGKCTFKTELKSTGSAALDTGIAALFGACGVLAAIQVYTVFSDPASHRTVSIDVFEDGKAKTLYGAAGNWTIEMTAGKRVMISWDFDGIWKAPADVALPAFAPNANAPMLFQGATVSIGGSARLVDNLNISGQNVVAARMDAAGIGGVAHWIITDNDPQINVDPEAELVAGYDVNGIWLAGTPQALSVALTDGSQTITITSPRVQFKAVPEGDREGIQIYDITGQLLHTNSTADDAFSFAVT